jgi:hypothetical protein
MVHERQLEAAVATAMWPTRHVSVLAVVSLTVGLIAGYLLLGGGTDRNCDAGGGWACRLNVHCPVAMLSIRGSRLNPVNWLLRLIFPAPQAAPWRNIAFDLYSALSCCLHSRRGVSPKQQRIARRFQRR